MARQALRGALPSCMSCNHDSWQRLGVKVGTLVRGGAHSAECACAQMVCTSGATGWARVALAKPQYLVCTIEALAQRTPHMTQVEMSGPNDIPREAVGPRILPPSTPCVGYLASTRGSDTLIPTQCNIVPCVGCRSGRFGPPCVPHLDRRASHVCLLRPRWRGCRVGVACRSSRPAEMSIYRLP